MRDICDRKFRKLHRLIFGYVLHIPRITILRVHLYYISKRLKSLEVKSEKLKLIPDEFLRKSLQRGNIRDE